MKKGTFKSKGWKATVHSPLTRKTCRCWRSSFIQSVVHVSFSPPSSTINTCCFTQKTERDLDVSENGGLTSATTTTHFLRMRGRDPTLRTRNTMKGEMIREVIEKVFKDSFLRYCRNRTFFPNNRPPQHSLGLKVALCKECTNLKVKRTVSWMPLWLKTKQSDQCVQEVTCKCRKLGIPVYVPSKQDRNIMVRVLGETQHAREIIGPDHQEQDEEDDVPVFFEFKSSLHFTAHFTQKAERGHPKRQISKPKPNQN